MSEIVQFPSKAELRQYPFFDREKRIRKVCPTITRACPAVFAQCERLAATHPEGFAQVELLVVQGLTEAVR